MIYDLHIFSIDIAFFLINIRKKTLYIVFLSIKNLYFKYILFILVILYPGYNFMITDCPLQFNTLPLNPQNILYILNI